MQALLLYWFSLQQQNSTRRLKKLRLFYLQFSAEFNEFKEQEGTRSGQKMAKTKIISKNADMRLSEAKG